MAESLPDSLVGLLKDTILCRESQLRQLCLLLGSQTFAPQTLAVHGVEATGKSLSVNALLNKLETPSAVVRCRECVTTRHTLERAISIIKETLRLHPTAPLPKETDGRCENLSAFVAELRLLLQGSERFILVFDNIDEQREASPTLLPGLARLGEVIPNLTTVLITHRAPSSSLRNSNALYLHYPPYTRDQSISILESSVFALGTLGPDARTSDGQPPKWIHSEEDTRWLWKKYVGHVWDSLGQGAARDLISFRRVCEKLWAPFVQPVVDGQYGVRGSQELAKLLVRNRSLLQKEDVLVGSLTSDFDHLSTTQNKQVTETPAWTLPYIPTLLLTAAYLASTTLPKHDITLFSRSSERRQRRRRAGTSASAANAKRKIPRRLLGPQPFVLERMLAIFHSLTDGNIKGGSAEIYSQFATLVKLGLIGKVGGAGMDVLDPSGKWRCLVGEDVVKPLGKGKGVDLSEWVVE